MYLYQKKLILHLACGYFPIVIFVVSLLILPNTASAGFCWYKGASADDRCELYASHSKKIKDGEVRNIYSENGLTLVSTIYFIFASYCESCGSAQDWSVTYTDIEHTPPSGHAVLNASNVKLSANFSFLSGADRYINGWQKNLTYMGVSTQLDNGGWSKDTSLQIDILPEVLAKLDPGIHYVKLTIQGSDYRSETVVRNIEYTFAFNLVKPQSLVKISGLKPMDFGTFPNHQSYLSQDLCVYASDSTAFSIAGVSSNGSASFYMSDGKGGRIGYNPYFSLRDSSSGHFLLSPTPQARDHNGVSLVSSNSEMCQKTGENMTLQIWLDDDFKTLSTKPAGTYIDTLTLTVAAE